MLNTSSTRNIHCSNAAPFPWSLTSAENSPKRHGENGKTASAKPKGKENRQETMPARDKDFRESKDYRYFCT